MKTLNGVDKSAMKIRFPSADQKKTQRMWGKIKVKIGRVEKVVIEELGE